MCRSISSFVGTLEERIDEMIERKKAIADNVIGAGVAHRAFDDRDQAAIRAQAAVS